MPRSIFLCFTRHIHIMLQAVGGDYTWEQIFFFFFLRDMACICGIDQWKDIWLRFHCQCYRSYTKYRTFSLWQQCKVKIFVSLWTLLMYSLFVKISNSQAWTLFIWSMAQNCKLAENNLYSCLHVQYFSTVKSLSI